MDPNALPTAPDWLITDLTDHGPTRWYRFQVQGINLNTGERFSWAVPSIADPRYAPADDVSLTIRHAIAMGKTVLA